MKKMSRKLTVAILSVALAFVALGATTFAWFTLTNTVEVGQFEGQVTVGTGFEVSIDDGINGYTDVANYYTYLPETIIESTLIQLEKSYNDGYRLTDMTSGNGTSFTNLKGVSMTSGYIEFDLKFRSTQSGAKIYLGNNTKIGRVGILWTPDKDFTGTHGDVTSGVSSTYYAADAVRVSIIEKGNAEAKAVVYESPTVEGGNTALGKIAIQNGAIDYYQEKTGISLLGSTEDYPTQNTLSDSVTEGVLANEFDFTGKDGYLIISLSSEAAEDGFYYGTVTVRVWIEGWDPDCFNAILKDNFSVELHFVTPEATE